MKGTFLETWVPFISSFYCRLTNVKALGCNYMAISKKLHPFSFILTDSYYFYFLKTIS